MKKRWATVIAVFVLAAFFLATLATVRDTSPLRVGSTPDEAWTYIHTTAAWGGGTPNMIGVAQSHKWSADGSSIYRETEFRWRSGIPFAVRKTTFYFGTNSTIRRISASWKYEWPASKKSAAVTPAQMPAAPVPETHWYHFTKSFFYANLARLKGQNTNRNDEDFLLWYFWKQGVVLSPAALHIN